MSVWIWVGMLLWTTSAAAQNSVVIERGRALAEARCGVCHGTGAADASPHKIAPPFHILDDDFPIEMLAGAARNNVIAGHDEMPMFELSESEMTALLSYIDSLSQAGHRYVPANK